MQGIEKITARIGQDARREAEARQAAAQAEADAIRARYEAQAEEIAQAVLAKGAQSAEDRAERFGSVASLEARKLRLSARQDMVEKAFALAEEKLLNLPDEEKVRFLAALAASAAVTGREKIVLSKGEHARFGKKVAMAANELLTKRGLPGELMLSGEPRDIPGGLILTEGEVEVNGSLPALMRAAREDLAAQVADILFAP